MSAIKKQDDKNSEHQHTLNSLVSAPSPVDRPLYTDDELKKRVSQLPEKYREAFERICAVRRDAAKELQINQRTNFTRMVQEESAMQLLRISVSEKPKASPEQLEQQAKRTGEDWARGVIDGQRAVLEDYFIGMKQRFIDQAESEHSRLRDQLQDARSRSRAKGRRMV
ncbi:hypothetical protein [Cerasicoccus frondis]|uniref:hypothetical protein n=1 Tax=Cerasicoccus frondis TaxID=490090 RepID=UPI002852B59F|nr:hypothetical protein [Cerasicoccus frondis]